MKRVFLYFANWNGRIIKCVIGFLLMIAGLYPSIYPLNVVALIAGAIVFAAGTGNVLILAPLFGFPMSGKRMRELYGQSHSSRLQEEAQASIRRDPGKTNSGMINAEVNTGSTTQGGSNFGQGSSYLAHDAQHQGKEKNRGQATIMSPVSWMSELPVLQQISYTCATNIPKVDLDVYGVEL